jgi:predicted peptidase
MYVPHEYPDDPDREWPLVVFLHGAGQRGTNVSQLDEHGPTREAAAGRRFPFILLAPQCPENSVWIMQRTGLSRP